VEEWFYLSLPAALLAAYSLGSAKNKSRFLIRVFVVYLLSFTVVRFINAFHPINGVDQDNGIRKVVLFRLDALMYGVVFAWLSIFRAELLQRWWKPLILLCLIGTAVLYYLMARRSLQLYAAPIPWVRFASDAFLFTIQPLVLSLCLPYAGNTVTLRSRAMQRITGFVSRISYSMYLIHFSLIFLPFFYRMPVCSPLMAIVYYAAYWAIVIVCSWLIYRFWEQPILRLRDKWH
jgi:peptidoglycan/LPS O-acetylase OafA/YrhL